MLLLIAFFLNHSLAQIPASELGNSWISCPSYGYNVISLDPDTYYPISNDLTVWGDCKPDGNVYEKKGT